MSYQLKPDPAASLEPVMKDGKVDEAADREQAMTARLTAWKREGKAADRKAAKDERVAVWEKQTGLKWEGVADVPGVSQRESR
jgi:hypothetical protein